MEERHTFVDNLMDACHAAGVGFHFEEGGCWGMAIALAETIRAEGADAQIVTDAGWRHALVRTDGRLLDYSGWVMSSLDDLSPVSEESLLEGFDRHGHYRDGIEADAEDARGIISNAANLDWSGWDRDTGRWVTAPSP